MLVSDVFIKKTRNVLPEKIIDTNERVNAFNSFIDMNNFFKKCWPKNLNTLRFYSNSYLHCTRPYGEINFKNVSVITEKMDNKLHNLTYSLQPTVIYNVILKSYFLYNLSIHIFSIITTE